MLSAFTPILCQPAPATGNQERGTTIIRQKRQASENVLAMIETLQVWKV
jgi:hypothetical protein